MLIITTDIRQRILTDFIRTRRIFQVQLKISHRKTIFPACSLYYEVIFFEKE
jgi:hypothetical protein